MSELKPEERLVPLRRFSYENLYSSAYLSLLVQRKKLKAKKIGRNFFTSEKWFREYLRLHAKDEIREKYQKILEKNNLTPDESSFGSDSSTPLLIRRGVRVKRAGRGIALQENRSVFVWKRVFSARNIAAVLGFAVVLLLVTQFRLMQDQGRISGVEEVNTDVASSTEAIFVNTPSPPTPLPLR